MTYRQVFREDQMVSNTLTLCIVIYGSVVGQTSSTRIVISFYQYRLKPYNLQFKNRHISSRVPLVQPWKIVFFEQ